MPSHTTIFVLLFGVSIAFAAPLSSVSAGTSNLNRRDGALSLLGWTPDDHCATLRHMKNLNGGCRDSASLRLLEEILGGGCDDEGDQRHSGSLSSPLSRPDTDIIGLGRKPFDILNIAAIESSDPRSKYISESSRPADRQGLAFRTLQTLSHSSSKGSGHHQAPATDDLSHWGYLKVRRGHDQYGKDKYNGEKPISVSGTNIDRSSHPADVRTSEHPSHLALSTRDIHRRRIGNEMLGSTPRGKYSARRRSQ